MTTSAFDEAFEKVKNLAATFKANEARYCSSDYKEADVRLDFIDPFLNALGWKRGQNPYQQELKVENHGQGVTQGRADYAFCIAPHCSDGEELFFLEAKKPHDNLETAGNYHQTISYGYSSRKPLAVLTDFEQFHILDCRYEPKLKTALDHWVDKFVYTDYLDRDKFAKIYWLFSREAFTSGSFDAKVKELRGKKTVRAPKLVDESLLERLDELRNVLAHSFKKNNRVFNSEELTEFAQRTLDRLVFLRFLEDKGIERPGSVNKLAGSANAWRDFIARCRQLDSIYNGIIYRQQPTLDAPTFRMDNAAFAEVCKGLAHSDTDYNFNFDFIPIHILGSIYERFLGKVIVATDKRVRVEDKPEVRKAGGVYYTPEYIVHYIVENTVGKLIEGKTPDQIAEMRFADIACGSGSFLLGVYDLLLTYHGTWYNANRNKARKGDCIEHDGNLYLSLAKKRDILMKNIYGVDIDAQAVEVCQLSLCLKLLKDESPETTAQYLLDFEHTAQMKKLLPDLSKNIVCGNSLIGTDILDDQLFASEEEKNLNLMNFEDAFPKVMEGGGFDAIVGNPPYIDSENMTTNDPELRKKIQATYQWTKGNWDIYIAFYEKAFDLANEDGLVSFITPDKWISKPFGDEMRLRTTDRIISILRVGREVFESSNVDAIVTLYGKKPQPQLRVYDFVGKEIVLKRVVAKSELKPPFVYDWLFSECVEFFASVEKHPKKLVDIATCENACATSDAYKLQEFIHEKSEARNKDEHLRIINTGTIGKYISKWGERDMVYLGKRYRKPVVGKKSFLAAFTNSYGRKSIKPKLIVKGLNLLDACLDSDGAVIPGKTTLMVTADKVETLKFLLGIVNSRVAFFYLKEKHPASSYNQGTTFTKEMINGLPIPDALPEAQRLVIGLVEQMLAAKKQLANAKTNKDRTCYERRCTSLDRQINALVYELYGLTEEEIKIVEGSEK